MKTVFIESTELKDLSPIVKDMINNGLYFLYDTTDKSDVKYVLSTNEGFSFLSETGRPIASRFINLQELIKDRVVFSDISQRLSKSSGKEWAY